MDKKKDERIKQAIIIADYSKTSFGHIQSQSPTCLIPCVNTPLLGYTIEFLIYNNISQLTIFAYEHKKAISDFLDSHNFYGIDIRLVRCSERPSVTSVIRELDGEDLIKGDFLLVNGHVITNIDISKAIEEHNKRKAQDVPMLMTKLFIKNSFESKRRSPQDLVTIVTNSETKEMYKYESMHNKTKSVLNKHFEFSQKKHASLDVAMSLIDCDIDIISHQSIVGILEDFSNFDQFKDEFINHVTESEIIVDKVYFHEVEGIDYFCRVTNPQVYFQA